jgi:hypothetical protein
MPKAVVLSLPMAEPIALLDATLLFIIQLFLAQHPNLLAPPESLDTHPGLRPARRVLDAVRELHHALESYSVTLAHASRTPLDATASADDDDIPF